MTYRVLHSRYNLGGLHKNLLVHRIVNIGIKIQRESRLVFSPFVPRLVLVIVLDQRSFVAVDVSSKYLDLLSNLCLPRLMGLAFSIDSKNAP
jgi:hypothetical protein